MSIQMKSRQIQLPIDQISVEVKHSLKTNQITIIETPTGSGKTMRLPYWVNQITSKVCYCLVPRVVMAKQALEGAKKVSFCETWHTGKEVAFATGKGDFGHHSAKVIYMTEGSFIARGIANKMVAGQYLLVDEVHEQGANTEAILIMAKELAARGVNIVLMSATIDAQKYINYFDGFKVGHIALPPKERPFPLTFEVVENPLKDIAVAAYQGGRCLIGVEGKMAIEKTIAALNKIFQTMGIAVPIFPFHAEMEDEEQDLVLKYKGSMIVVATNVLQSGVTITGLNYGWFNGLGNRKEIVKGRAAIKEYELSKAEMTQWFGRIGRTENGTILWTKEEAEKFQKRDGMTTPEILRIPLEETVLMFQSIGLNLNQVQCLNQPTQKVINDSEFLLAQLGCLDSLGIITELGREVFKQGVGLRGGLIQVYGDKFGLPNLVRKMALMVGDNHPFRKVQYGKFRNIIKDLDYCDLLAWVRIIETYIEKYVEASDKKFKIVDFELFKQDCEENGLFRKTLTSLMKQFIRIDNEGHIDQVLSPTDLKTAIQRIFKASFEDTLISRDWGSWKTPEGLYPRVADNSLIDEYAAKTIVGEITIIPTPRGSLTLLSGNTIIDYRD